MSHTSEMSFTTASSSSNDVESMAIIGPQLDQSFETSSSGSDSESSSAGSSESDSDTGIGVTFTACFAFCTLPKKIFRPTSLFFANPTKPLQNRTFFRITFLA